MSNRAWLFPTITGGRLDKPMTHNFRSEGRLDFAIECGERNARGESLGSECFPSQIFPKQGASEKAYNPLPDTFFAGSFWVVSGEVADVMRGFDLGEGHLHPVEISGKGLEKESSKPWFCLNFGNLKSAFLAEKSTGYDLWPGDRWSPRLGVEIETMLSRDAAVGPDIWIDGTVANAFFLSGPLGDAINATNAGKHFHLIACRLAEAGPHSGSQRQGDDHG